MSQPELIFRCPVCERDINIPMTEFEQVPICETDRRIMVLVGGAGDEVNQGVREVMSGLTRLVVAALTKAPSTGPSKEGLG